MKLEDARVGMRVRSYSNGCTGGWVGTIKELARHPSHPDALIVAWDNGMKTGVGVALCEPASVVPVPAGPSEGVS